MIEGVRRVQGKLVKDLSRPNHPMAQVQVVCQKGGEVKSGRDCLNCHRLLVWRDGRDGDSVFIDCLWTEHDRVRDLMTKRPALATVTPSTEVQAADDLAERTDVRHLGVLDGERLVGVLCRCDLATASPDQEVSECMQREIVSVESNTSLGKVIEIMNERRVGCLPVVDEGGLVGIITRGDLRRAGFPGELLQTEQCASCGTVHGVMHHPRYEQVAICLECFRAGMHASEIDDSEMGATD